ncbi:MAG: FGGY family carbohydrate kinase [Cyclonatronaceae bacterium]
MAEQYILALDQGTTSSRAIVFDKKGKIVSTVQKEFRQICPKAGWVDGDASANNLLMQFQSDVLQAPVARPDTLETTALKATVAWSEA